MNESDIREMIDRIVSGCIAQYKLERLAAWADKAVMSEVKAWNEAMDTGKLPPTYDNPDNPSYDRLSVDELLDMIDMTLSSSVVASVAAARKRYREMKASSEAQ